MKSHLQFSRQRSFPKWSQAIVVLLTAISTTILVVACNGDKPTDNQNKAQNSVTTLQPANPSTDVSIPALPVPAPPAVPGTGFLLMDFASGQVLAARSESARLPPASLTKIMTAYAVFDSLRAGGVKLDDMVTISEHAWRSGGAVTEGSTSFLKINSQVPVEVLLQGMIVQSGNDASIALAERIAGSEDAFAQLMNSYAQRLGMQNSHFDNATGLPSQNQFTTAYDMARLSQAIIRDFPQYYHYFSEKQYTYNGITQHNRNGLLSRDSSVDGLKTGHTESAGYCLVTSAKRNDMRLITVVLGTVSINARESATASLLNYGFSFFESKSLYAANQVLGSVRVWKGKERQVNAVVKQSIDVVVPRGRAGQVQATLSLPKSTVAPITSATELGNLVLMLDGKVIGKRAVLAETDVAESGMFGRWIDGVRMKFE